jgi:hypothetical protein
MKEDMRGYREGVIGGGVIGGTVGSSMNIMKLIQVQKTEL